MAARFGRFLAVIMACVALLSVSGTASAALERPTYIAGDRWRYALAGALNTFPGLDPGNGMFDLDLAGTVEVEVLGAADANVGGIVVPAVRVATRTSASLSGTISIPDAPLPGTVSIRGTLFSNATELWETVGYLPVESDGRSVLGADVTVIVAVHVDVETDFDATTSFVQNVPFPLDVGQGSVASLSTNLTVRSTITAFGPPIVVENSTSFSTEWKRTVVSQETITVEAGTFSTYKLNQSLALGFIPGLGPVGSIPAGNETAYFSNEVGYYVKRVAYANGTPVSELRLKSYVYAARASPISLLTFALIGGAAVVVAVPFGWLLYHRRKRPTPPPESPPPPPRPEGGQGPG